MECQTRGSHSYKLPLSITDHLEIYLDLHCSMRFVVSKEIF